MPEIKAEATRADEFGGETLEPGSSQRENLAVALGEGCLKLGARVWPHFSEEQCVLWLASTEPKGKLGLQKFSFFSLNLLMSSCKYK